MGLMHQDRTDLFVKGIRDGLPIGLGYLSVAMHLSHCRYRRGWIKV